MLAQCQQCGGVVTVPKVRTADCPKCGFYDTLKRITHLDTEDRAYQLKTEVKAHQCVMIESDLLKKLVDDYEHCAPDADGKISRWRLNLIKKLREMLS